MEVRPLGEQEVEDGHGKELRISEGTGGGI